MNCNVCQNDQACQSVKGSNATCIKSAIGLKSMHAWCDTTSKCTLDARPEPELMIGRFTQKISHGSIIHTSRFNATG